MENLQDTVQRIMDEAVAEHEVAGVNLLVLKDGETILKAESGCADIARGVPVRQDTIFRLYSMSKPVTSAAVMILLERGMVDLYDPVSRYLPGFKNQMVAEPFDTAEEKPKLVPVKREVTLHDLLSMTSGLLYGGANAAGQAAGGVIDELINRMDGPEPMGTVELANRLGAQPLMFHPGEHFAYGTSADILGAVIEVVSGVSFGEFLRREIFEPLGMSDTGFYVPQESRARFAKTYEYRGGAPVAEYPTRNLGISDTMEKAPAFESGGAGLVSTLPDYAKFATMLLNMGASGGVRILRPATVRYMTTASMQPWQQKDLWDTLGGYAYGNLLRIMKDPGQSGMITTFGEYGWDGWLGPFFSNHPAEQLTFLMGMQLRDAGTTRLTRRVRNVVLSRCL